PGCSRYGRYSVEAGERERGNGAAARIGAKLKTWCSCSLPSVVDIIVPRTIDWQALSAGNVSAVPSNRPSSVSAFRPEYRRRGTIPKTPGKPAVAALGDGRHPGTASFVGPGFQI